MSRLRNVPTEPSHIAWPNVLVNAKVHQYQKTTSDTALSIITNHMGTCRLKLDGRSFKVCESTLLILNTHQNLRYEIESEKEVETCNIHFNAVFVQQVLNTMIHNDETLLDDPFADKPHSPQFINQLHYKALAFSKILTRQHTSEEMFLDLLLHMLQIEQQSNLKIKNIKATKPSVRKELYQRICLAKDYIYGYYDHPWILDELCHKIGMSKYHFLRVFKDCFGISAYHMLKQVRLARAQTLLQQTDLSIDEIAIHIGYEETNSFFKAFKEAYATTPGAYRRHLK